MKLGIPTFSNFKVFLKILARDFLLLHYNEKFIHLNERKRIRTFFNLTAKLALINSKPAIYAVEDQKNAMNIEQNFSM